MKTNTAMETTTSPERLVATITPESLAPLRYRIQCRQCGRTAKSDSRSYVDAYAESHVREHGHTVEILEHTDPDQRTCEYPGCTVTESRTSRAMVQTPNGEWLCRPHGASAGGLRVGVGDEGVE